MRGTGSHPRAYHSRHGTDSLADRDTNGVASAPGLALGTRLALGVWFVGTKPVKAIRASVSPNRRVTFSCAGSRNLYNALVILLHCMDVIAPNHRWRARLKDLISRHAVRVRSSDGDGFPSGLGATRDMAVEAGMPAARHPFHRSIFAGLPPTAPTLGRDDQTPVRLRVVYARQLGQTKDEMKKLALGVLFMGGATLRWRWPLSVCWLVRDGHPSWWSDSGSPQRHYSGKPCGLRGGGSDRSADDAIAPKRCDLELRQAGLGKHGVGIGAQPRWNCTGADSSPLPFEPDCRYGDRLA